MTPTLRELFNEGRTVRCPICNSLTKVYGSGNKPIPCANCRRKKASKLR